METKNRFSFSIIMLVLVSAIIIGEAECKTRLVMGRKTINRTYYKEPAIPAWATVTLTGIGILLVGVVLYFVMHKVYLHDQNLYAPQYMPANRDETPA